MSIQPSTPNQTGHRPDPSRELATLGGGCFWCLEAVFLMLEGVHRVQSGYAGGHTTNPTYREVCSGSTGHAEVVQIEFDPSVISFRDLLQVFFTIHDPTTLNRQGADVGTQYRSVIYYHSPEQQATAQAVMQELDAQGLWADPIVTELSALPQYYVAEDYHQDYYANNMYQPYCQYVVAPKVAKTRKEFLDRLKATAKP